MRHHNAFRKLNRNAAHRKALFRNMVTSLIVHEQFQTTVAKAKELKRIADKIITLGKTGDLHSRRQAFSYVMDKAAVHKLFAELGPRYKARKGGYTRVLKTGTRHGDASDMAIIELVDRTVISKPVSTKPAKAEKAEVAA